MVKNLRIGQNRRIGAFEFVVLFPMLPMFLWLFRDLFLRFRGNRETVPLRRSARRDASLLALIVVLWASTAATYQWPLTSILLLGSHYCAAWGLRGPRLRSRPFVASCLFTSFALTNGMFLGLYGVTSVTMMEDPLQILAVALLTMAAIPGSMLVFRWTRFFRSTRGRVAGAVAMLAIACLPLAVAWRDVVREPVLLRQPLGEVYVYVDDPGRAPWLTVNVFAHGFRRVRPRTNVFIDLHLPRDQADRPLEWALVLVGDARLRRPEVYGVASLSVVGEAQVVRGVFDRSNPDIEITGTPVTQLADSTTVKEIVELPTFAIDHDGEASRQLGLHPVLAHLVPPTELEMLVGVSGALSTTELEHVSPAPDKDDRAVWTSNSLLEPTYVAHDPIRIRRLDAALDLLSVFGMVCSLAIALAAIVAADPLRRAIVGYFSDPPWELPPIRALHHNVG